MKDTGNGEEEGEKELNNNKNRQIGRTKVFRAMRRKSDINER